MTTKRDDRWNRFREIDAGGPQKFKNSVSAGKQGGVEYRKCNFYRPLLLLAYAQKLSIDRVQSWKIETTCDIRLLLEGKNGFELVWMESTSPIQLTDWLLVEVTLLLKNWSDQNLFEKTGFDH